MRLYFQLLGALLVAGLIAWPQQGRSAAPGLVSGVVELPGVTGGAALGGDRLLLVSKERNTGALIRDASARLRSGRVIPADDELLTGRLAGRVALEDLQDAASDEAGSAFLIGSHARTPRGDSPEERYRITRLRFDAAGSVVEARQSGSLLDAIVNELPFLADSIRRTPAKAGLSIEGLAAAPDGQLLVGFRSPTVTESSLRPHGGQEDAVLVRVRNPDAIFADPAQPAVLGDVVKLDLRGQGIRGMCYDPDRKAFWLLSGLSAQPTHPVKSPWRLWLWNERDPPQPFPLPEGLRLERPTAVVRVVLGGESRLLLVQEGRPRSEYTLLPVPTSKG
jgi:hypothetical protein